VEEYALVALNINAPNIVTLEYRLCHYTTERLVPDGGSRNQININVKKKYKDVKRAIDRSR